jgi:hypothetical protein
MSRSLGASGVAHPAVFNRLPVGFLPVRLIAEDFPLLQQGRATADVGCGGIARPHSIDDGT